MCSCFGVEENQCVHSRSADRLRVFGQARADFPRRRAAVHRMMIALVGTRLTEAERPGLGRRSLGAERDLDGDWRPSPPHDLFIVSPPPLFSSSSSSLSLSWLLSLSLTMHGRAAGGPSSSSWMLQRDPLLPPPSFFLYWLFLLLLSCRHLTLVITGDNTSFPFFFPSFSSFYSNCFSSSSSSSTIPPPVKLYHV